MTRLPSCLSELAYAALLQYCPDGVTGPSLQSREHTRRIKRGSPAHMDRIGERSLDCYERGCFGAIFDTEAILVPVPRSRPLKDERALWPARRIAEELASRGLGCDVRACLERREPIEKSALQRVGAKRPLPEDHLRTIRVVDVMFVSASRVVLVDDVVTRGATLLACATLLSRAFPSTAVSAFAAVRTMSGPGREIEGMLAPVTGVITYANGRLHREP